MNSNSKWITSGDFIAKTLKKCKKCFKITDQARMIIPHNKLLSLSLPNIKNFNKFAIIVNSETNDSSLGHWFTLVIFRETLLNNHFLVLCDGLNKIFSNHPNIMQNIFSFCKKNQLKFLNLDLRYQLPRSLCCGHLALFIVARATNLSFRGFLIMKKTLQRHSIATNEKYMLNFTTSHFKL